MARAVGFQKFHLQELDKLWPLRAIDDGWQPTRSLGDIRRILTSPLDVLDQSAIAYGVIIFVAIFVNELQNLCGVNALKTCCERRATQTRLHASSKEMS